MINIYTYLFIETVKLNVGYYMANASCTRQQIMRIIVLMFGKKCHCKISTFHSTLINEFIKCSSYRSGIFKTISIFKKLFRKAMEYENDKRYSKCALYLLQRKHL